MLYNVLAVLCMDSIPTRTIPTRKSRTAHKPTNDYVGRGLDDFSRCLLLPPPPLLSFWAPKVQVAMCFFLMFKFMVVCR